MNLFVYGTLLLPEIRYALLNRNPEVRNAILKDYSVTEFCRNNQKMEYPILKYCPDEQANGLLLNGLSEKEMKIISHYEGDDYQIKILNVSANNSIVKAKVFMYKYPERIKIGTSWDIDGFSKYYLKNYVQIYIPKMLSKLK
jgi:hypothetical protein